MGANLVMTQMSWHSAKAAAIDENEQFLRDKEFFFFQGKIKDRPSWKTFITKHLSVRVEWR